MTLTATPDPTTKAAGPRHRRRWTQPEKKHAVRLICSGYTVEEAAGILRRDEWAIRGLFSHTFGIRPERLRVVERDVAPVAEWNVPLFDVRGIS